MRVFVDRFEEDQAVLLLGENEEVKIALPMRWLPHGTNEGVILRIDLTIDEDATRRAKAEVEVLYDGVERNT